MKAGFVEDWARHARMMARRESDEKNGVRPHFSYLPINERMPSAMNGESAMSRSSGKVVIRILLAISLTMGGLRA